MELTSGLIDNFVISRYFVISDLVATRVYCVICLIVVDLEYVATSLCSLLSNTGFFAYRFFCLFIRSFRAAKNPDFNCISKYHTLKSSLYNTIQTSKQTTLLSFACLSGLYYKDWV